MDKELAWLAGIIDGEGSITAQVLNKKDGRIRITPFISIVNNDQLIIDECNRILDLLQIKHKWTLRPKSNVYNMRIDGNVQVEKTIKILLPYLKSYKKNYGEKILQYIDMRKNLFERNDKGQIKRRDYTVEEVKLISSIRTHHHATPLTVLLQAPNVENKE